MYYVLLFYVGSLCPQFLMFFHLRQALTCAYYHLVLTELCKISIIISGGLYRGDVSETLSTCLVWSSRSSWTIWYLSFKNPPKNETVRTKKLFLDCGLEGGLEKNGFTQILFISKTFKINFMSWETDLGSLSPFPLLKLHINFLSIGKRHVLINFRGVHDFFLATAV